MKTRHLVSLATITLFGAASLAACDGGGDSSKEAETAPSLTVDDYLEARASILCEGAFSCCDQGELRSVFPHFYSPPESEEQCESDYSFYVLNTGAVKFGIESGRMAYDGVKAAACIEQMRTASCFDLFATHAQPPACVEVFEGKLSEGAGCSLLINECAGEGAYCASGPDGSSACSLGVPEGGLCDTALCAAGLTCVADMQQGTMQCAPLRLDGESCQSYSDCASLRCHDSVCAPRSSNDAACASDSDCVSYHCDASHTCTEGLCDGK